MQSPTPNSSAAAHTGWERLLDTVFSNADLMILAAVTFLALLALVVWSAQYRAARRTVLISGMLTAVVLLIGSWLVFAEGEAARKRLRHGLEGFAPTYAAEIAVRGHHRLPSNASADDPLYLDLIAAQKRWLRLNPSVTDVYTVRRDAHGTWRFIVDSETDYDRDGVINGAREERTLIGEQVVTALDSIGHAASGHRVFVDHSETDRWGKWVSAFEPVYAPDGSIEAVLGVDFPAQEWDGSIASARGGMLGYLAVMLGILVGGAALHISYRRHLLAKTASEQRLFAQAAELAAARDSLAASHHELEHKNDQLARVTAQAVSASRAKGDFLANMSHEIRTPLTAILGFADMLKDPELPVSLRVSHAETIKRSGKHLVEIINSILDFSKIESGRMTVEIVACDVRTIVTEAVALLQPLAARKSIELSLTWQPGTPSAIRSDPMRLREVLINLIGNAIKYTEAGCVRVDVTASAGTDGTPSLFFAVSDTGIGLSAQQLGHLFQPFQQADNSHARRFGGTGLGLAISLHFAERLGGTIAVRSSPGAGSVFTFSVAVNPEVDEPSSAAHCPPIDSTPLAIAQQAPLPLSLIRN